MIRVLVVDDHAMVRAGLRAVLDGEPDIEVVSEAADGTAAIRCARETRPDVVMMDVSMPLMDGLDATQAIVADEQLAEVRVLMIATFDSEECVVESLRSGARGFLAKDSPPEELVRGVRVTAAGDALLSPRAARHVIAEVSSRPRSSTLPTENLTVLTSREREVLTLIGAGLSNGEIAQHLFITPATAKTHVGRIFAKLAARDRAQLVILAYETGLAVPGERQRPPSL
jgi:DNA-binding NarL/FixJ family response regulator